MSGTSGATPRPPDPNEATGAEVMIMVSIIVALLLFLLVLRHVTIIVIDCCVGDYVSARRRALHPCYQQNSGGSRYCCWRRRHRGRNNLLSSTNIRNGSTGTNQPTTRSTVEIGGGGGTAEGTSVSDVKRLLEGLSSGERKALLLSAMISKVVTTQDVALLSAGTKIQDIANTAASASTSTSTQTTDDEELGNSISSQPAAVGPDHEGNNENDNDNNDNDDCEKGNLTCSICLHDIASGNMIMYSKTCSHIFHRRCLQDWIEVNIDNSINICCPYCRTNMITDEEIIKRAT